MAKIREQQKKFKAKMAKKKFTGIKSNTRNIKGFINGEEVFTIGEIEKTPKIKRNKECKECPQNKREDVVWNKGYEDGIEQGKYRAQREIVELIKLCNEEALNESEKEHGRAILYVIKMHKWN